MMSFELFQGKGHFMLNLLDLITALRANTNAFTISLFVLLIVSEVLGTVDSIKAGSIFTLIRSILMTIKDQAFPAPKA